MHWMALETQLLEAKPTLKHGHLLKKIGMNYLEGRINKKRIKNMKLEILGFLKKIYCRYGTGLSFARLITDVTSKFNTQALLDDVSWELEGKSMRDKQ